MKTDMKVKNNASHILLPHLPSPPASILAIGPDAQFNKGKLASLGYEITVRRIGEFCQDGIDPGEKKDQTTCTGGAFPPIDPDLSEKPFDTVVLEDFPELHSFLERHLKSIRGFLKPTGGLIFCAEIPEEPLYQLETGMPKSVLTALYENGFRIKKVEKIVHHQKKRNCSMVVARKDKVFLRVYENGDELNILPMFREVFQNRRTMAHWQWKFRDNPFANHKVALAVTKDGFLVAHFCGYAVPFYSSVSSQKEFLSFQGADTMTHPEFRRLGLGSTSVLTRVTTYFFNKFCVDNMPFMYGYNTGNIKKFGERFLGYRYMSPIPYHVLDLKRVDGSSWIAKWGPRKCIPFLTVKRVTRMEADFDRLFKRASRDYGMLVKKDATYLKWRYLDCPDQVHQLFSIRFFGKLVGWCVFSLRGRVLIWGDALFEKKYVWCIKMMFDPLLKKHFQKVQRIEGWFSRKPEWWTKALKKAGFVETADPNNLAAGIIFFDTVLSLPFVDQNLYYTMGDSDLF
jgi:hypothetical protein